MSDLIPSNLRREGKRPSMIKCLKMNNLDPEDSSYGYTPIIYKKLLRAESSIIERLKFDPPVYSNNTTGVVYGFGANTTCGVRKDVNEDRVTVIINPTAPEGFKGTWPDIQFFGIYDGHGGDA